MQHLSEATQECAVPPPSRSHGMRAGRVDGAVRRGGDSPGHASTCPTSHGRFAPCSRSPVGQAQCTHEVRLSKRGYSARRRPGRARILIFAPRHLAESLCMLILNDLETRAVSHVCVGETSERARLREDFVPVATRSSAGLSHHPAEKTSGRTRRRRSQLGQCK